MAAGTGNASIPAAQRGATRDRERPDARAASRRAGARAEAEGVELEWVEADAENLPFEDESFDVVMSSIGAMFAPHHQDVADELVRVCRPGGTIGMLNWTPGGDDRRAVQDDGPVRAAASARRVSPRRCGAARTTCASCSATASTSARSSATCSRSRRSSTRTTTASTSRRATARRSCARKNAEQGRPRGGARRGARRASATSGTSARDEDARFEQEYLVAVGTRR